MAFATRALPAAALALLLMLGSAGCAGAGGDSGVRDNDNTTGDNDNTSGDNDNTSGDNENATSVLTECVDGLWEADLDDLAGQLGDFLGGSGLAVTSATGSGIQQLSIGAEGVLGFANDMTFVIAIDMSGGLTMTVTQVHKGDMGASWSWSGDESTDAAGTMAFRDIDDGAYSVTTSVDINGRSGEMPVSMPPVVTGKLPTEITCADGTMTTHPQGSPFTTTWHYLGEG